MKKLLHRWTRGRRLAVALLLAALGALGVVVVIGNDYRVDLERVQVRLAEGGSLDVVLATPPDEPVRGLVVMVHGDGPVEATMDGLYLPWFEAAADAGFATLSWSKPGVGDSEGDWLTQSMDDRAAEVSAVLDWALGRPEVPAVPIVLWGASQGGWVVPKVAAARADIAGVVAVSPAINWLRQGRFHLLAELDHAGATQDERAEAVRVSDQTRDLLEEGASYQEYREESDDPEPMDAARWGFVSRNWRADASADLAAMPSDLAVLLMLGRQDRNVDIEETEETYGRLLGDRLRTVRWDAAHSMARPRVETSPVLGWVTAVVWPRALLAPGVLEGYGAFLRDLGGRR